MSELVEALISDSYAAPPAHILEGISEELATRSLSGAPHTIYQELWHLAFWQAITLDWIGAIETPFPERPQDAFPTGGQHATETWAALRERFLRTAGEAAAIARNPSALATIILCPSRPGQASRSMSIEDQLISLAAHNAYHLGRIVLLRQMLGAWPPPSGGFTW